MKKNIIIAAIIGILIVVGWYGSQKYDVPNVTRVNQSITAVLNTGEEVSTVSDVQADNAFTALTALAKQKNLELKTKQYDFGVFVEQIGTFANTEEKSWIYFVNGNAGTVAADKQPLNAGDTVEWKYLKPVMQ